MKFGYNLCAPCRYNGSVVALLNSQMPCISSLIRYMVMRVCVRGW